MEILWVNVLAACSLAFRLSGNKQFRTFLEYLNPDIEVWFPPSHSVIQGWVMRQFVDKDGTLQAMVLALKSIVGDYTGESLVVPILEVLDPKEWNFMKKLGFFM